MTEFSSAVAVALGKLIDSGKIEAAIQKQLEETVTGIVREHMRGWSDFGKALQVHIQQSLAVNLDKLTLPAYNEVIIDVIRKELDRAVHIEGAAALAKGLERMLGDVPKEIKLSRLVEDYKESIRFWHDLDGEEDHEITVRVESPSSTTISRWIHMDAKSDVDRYACNIAMLISPLDPMQKEPLTQGKISNLTFKQEREKNRLFIGDFHSFERDLFHMHANKTILLLDEDAIDRSLPPREDEGD